MWTDGENRVANMTRVQDPMAAHSIAENRDPSFSPALNSIYIACDPFILQRWTKPPLLGGGGAAGMFGALIFFSLHVMMIITLFSCGCYYQFNVIGEIGPASNPNRISLLVG